MRIVDAHHHFWDPVANDHPWLRQSPPIPFRYGDYAAIRGPFLPQDYDRAAQGWDVVASVTMEGEWNPDDPTGEALWMQRLADRTGRPAAHVAQAWLDRADLPQVLSAYARLPLVRSVRHKPRANPAPGGPPGGMADPAFQDGFRRLADSGLMFDLQTPWWHLREAEALSAIAPHVPLILNHSGLPADRSAAGLAGWRAAVQGFAALENTFVKISGLGLAGRPWRAEDNVPLIRDLIRIFGPDRAMIASNFPVDGLCGSFDTIFRGFLAATRDLSPTARDALFAGTALRTYGIVLASGAGARA
jgi:predicted TIM-barrel fold metal-dependent hydrolase